MDKPSLRWECLQKRASILGREEKDRAIFRHITSLAAWEKAHRVYLYLSARGEPDTFALARAALRAGKEALAPVCLTGAGQMGRMEFYAFTDFAQLRPGKWGILEPDPQLCRPSENKNGLCLVPGLAFDKSGARLGYGKGYYDRFLAAMEIDTVGVCYEALFFESIPAESHDKRVGRVATEAGVRVCAQEGSKL